MNREQFIEYITKIGFGKILCSYIYDHFFQYKNDDVDCYIILRGKEINLFAYSTDKGVRLLDFTGNETQIKEKLKDFLKKDIRDLLLNNIINS